MTNELLFDELMQSFEKRKTERRQRAEWKGGLIFAKNLIKDTTQVSFNSCLCFFTIAMGGKRMILIMGLASYSAYYEFTTSL